MHETAIAKSIINQAEKEAKKRKVNSIEIDVGELAHLPAEELQQVLMAMTDWNVKINSIPAKIECSCGFTGNPVITERGHDFALYHCPKCENTKNIEIKSGKDIVIKNISVE